MKITDGEAMISNFIWHLKLHKQWCTVSQNGIKSGEKLIMTGLELKTQSLGLGTWFGTSVQRLET